MAIMARMGAVRGDGPGMRASSRLDAAPTGDRCYIPIPVGAASSREAGNTVLSNQRFLAIRYTPQANPITQIPAT